MATKEVKIKDKTFITSIPEETILKRVSEVAESISRDYADKNPLFLATRRQRRYGRADQRRKEGE